MRASGLALLTALVLLSGATAGCVKNMGELKTALGYGPEAPTTPTPPPDAKPPVARLTANTTSTLIGVPVKLSAGGSRDPQGLPLDYQWDFGDGKKETGSDILHSYARAGDFRVTLTVTNSEDLSAIATTTISVKAGNRAPSAAFTIQNAKGDTVTAAAIGETLTFSSAGSTDPDNDPLTYAWTFGDAATSDVASPTHSYAAPGLYVIELTVKDKAGATAKASKAVAVNFNATFEGEFGPQDQPALPARNVTKSHTFPLAAGASLLTVKLTFDASGGFNDLTLEVLDHAKKRVVANATSTEPLQQGDVVKTFTLPSEGIKPYTPGTWTVNVVKERGLQAAYTVEILETV